MIITRLTGGLGNQMFQYAFGRSLSLRRNTELKLDLRFFSDRHNAPPNPVRTYDLDIFNIYEAFATRREIRLLSERMGVEIFDRLANRLMGVKGTHIREPHHHFSEAAYSSPDNVYLSGYWQSEKYFTEHADIIRNDFTFRDQPSENASSILHDIDRLPSICVHVRRGDFLINPLNGLHGIDYYKKGEEILSGRVSDPHFFVFSDDPDWCKDNLSFNGPTVLVSDDFGERKFRDDLRLMSRCKHFIIANSSFSWWPAWLSSNSDKIVVCPKAWFADDTLDTSDLIPSGWIKI